MASLSLRDRFLTPPVARAITSPSGILVAAAGASTAILVGLPVVAVAGVGALAWAARVGFAVPRNAAEPRIDAGRLKEPWRNFVREAQQAQQQFAQALSRAPKGPLHDRLATIADRIASGVHECWKVAQAGNDLAIARGQIDLADITRQRQGVDADAAAMAGSAAAGTLEALDAQLAAVARMDRVIADTTDRLRLLDARLDEAVTRAIELSVRADSPDELRGLGDDVDSLVGDMESLRLGLDEVDGSTSLPPPPAAPPPAP
jgi:hypothetical protein